LIPYLEAAGLAKSFRTGRETRHVLHRVCLSIERGEIVAIVGRMGSGKSTLLGMLAGLVRPDGGHVTVDGDAVSGVLGNAAFVFQNYSLLPWLTALENVRLAVEAALPALTKREQQDLAREMLERVGLGHALTRRPRQLSGGMRQRVAIARAFATRPEILFLDEPFGALDAMTRETLQQELAQLCRGHEQPVTTVMITNSLDEAILLADRIVPVIAGPPATLGTPIAVTLPHPRTATQFARDETAAGVRAHVVATLTASLMRRPAGIAPRAAGARAMSVSLVAEETP
jgi:nitrate/nitrite transport system ATP-binding protein